MSGMLGGRWKSTFVFTQWSRRFYRSDSEVWQKTREGVRQIFEERSKGNDERVLNIYKKMREENIPLNISGYGVLLDLCGKLLLVKEGTRIHEEIKNNNYFNNISVVNRLLKMYSRCGKPEEVFKLFDEVKKNIPPDYVTYVILIITCAEHNLQEEGKMLHDTVIQKGLEENCKMLNALIKMYGNFKQPEVAFKLFRKMRPQGIQPDDVTYNTLFMICESHRLKEEGKKLHEEAKALGLMENPAIVRTLKRMYYAFGNKVEARKLAWQLQQLLNPPDADTPQEN